MDKSKERQPTPLAQLKEQSIRKIGPAHEYSIRSWINAARDSFERAASSWRGGEGDSAQLEDAFISFRRGAHLLNQAKTHPGWAQRSAQDKELYSRVLLLASDASKSQEEIKLRLEQREADWIKRHGKIEVASVASTSRAAAQANGSSTPAATSSAGSGRTGALNGGSSSRSAPTDERPAVSPPLNSIEDRLAALRARGVETTSALSRPAAPRPTNPPPVAYVPPPAVSTSSPRQAALRAPGSPPIPRKPESLQGRSPPPSPKARVKGDFVDDSAVQRTGSAPPAIPRSESGGSDVFAGMGLQLNQALSNGGAEDARTGGSRRGSESADGPTSPYEQVASLPSPTAFTNFFPSIDDFEKTVPGGSSSNGDFAFPSVPSSLPSSSPTQGVRSSLPPPPRPFELDTGDFDREQKERSAAAALLGGASMARSSSSEVALASRRSDLPSSLVPGGGSQPSSTSYATSTSTPPTVNATPSRSPLPPPPVSASQNFSIPFTAEVSPTALYSYLVTAQAEAGKGPRVLLLDVRSRDEYDRGRVMGESVCLEPVVIRPGISSSGLESALSLSPKHEQALFAARNCYDMVVIYDRASLTTPNAEPPSTSPEAQHVLWTLNSAIYEREFYKSLKRQPVLLKGGWEAWEKYVGVKGIVRDGEAPAAVEGARRRTSLDEFGQLEAKKAHRKASIVPGGGPSGASLVKNPSAVPLGSPYGQPTSSSNGSYFPPASTYTSNYSSSSNSLASSGVISPRLAMPPTAAQRSGSIPSFDAYSSTSSFSASTTLYGQHPQQPHINGMSSYTSPSYTSAPPLPLTRSGFGEGHDKSPQSFTSYPRPSIDYPQLQPRAPPPVSQATRPPPLPAAPLARPPPVQPAPQRSNSSFNGLHQVSSYSSARSQFPTDLNFNDNSIGLTGLKNLGNTCYMNSTIQCLSATIPFARYFKDRSYKRDINTVNPLGTRGALADAVAELIRAIWAQQYTFLSPVTFRENICRVAPQFRGSDQHDAQEFLGFLLDGLHEDLNYVVKKPKPIEMTPDREHDLETLPPQIMSDREWEIYRMRNDSFVVQCFQGQFRNQLKCLTCGKTSTTYNTFMPLSIPIPSGRGLTRASLEDCIKAFVREEILDKDDAWFCPRCKTNRKASKRLTLSRLPPILVIHLKRFSFKGPFSDKIETQVQYPLSGLDLTSYLPPPLFDKRGPPPSSSTKGNVYDLFAVTNHYGNLSSGHYTAFVRSGREWHNIGDSKCTQVDPRVVESAKSAYILYYALR
ncbi:hypothetical protein BCR35DRAFT_30267 [Leucosporidium creatinivorum]|uniref:ubiquitinyl hydrolase 1 n=1 Tax=Leucosporidium creatinivorum TaxID=106004 RepID=A0A1Y2FXY5_9BASI|nr:hypothetical protein BCR35DRAFT_30267 [Leucosporidium creatinivorum]